MAHFWKREVKLRYNPEDMDSVYVYCAATGDFLCEAFDMMADTPRYTVADVKQTRTQYKRGLIERTRRYMSAVFDNDRNASERHEIEARKLALKEQDASEKASCDLSKEQSMKFRNLFTIFRRQDSGKG
jgi:hypothetical protein